MGPGGSTSAAVTNSSGDSSLMSTVDLSSRFQAQAAVSGGAAEGSFVGGSSRSGAAGLPPPPGVHPTSAPNSVPSGAAPPPSRPPVSPELPTLEFLHPTQNSDPNFDPFESPGGGSIHTTVWDRDETAHYLLWHPRSVSRPCWLLLSRVRIRRAPGRTSLLRNRPAPAVSSSSSSPTVSTRARRTRCYRKGERCRLVLCCSTAVWRWCHKARSWR